MRQLQERAGDHFEVLAQTGMTGNVEWRKFCVAGGRRSNGRLLSIWRFAGVALRR
jgi:hypothetical protein